MTGLEPTCHRLMGPRRHSLLDIELLNSHHQVICFLYGSYAKKFVWNYYFFSSYSTWLLLVYHYLGFQRCEIFFNTRRTVRSSEGNGLLLCIFTLLLSQSSLYPLVFQSVNQPRTRFFLMKVFQSCISLTTLLVLQRTEKYRVCFGKSGIHGWGLFARRSIQEGEMVRLKALIFCLECFTCYLVFTLFSSGFSVGC